MFTSILIPTDGGKDMRKIVEYGVDLAELCDAEIHVLHVVDERAYLSVPDDARDRVRDTLEADGESFTKSVAERAISAGLDVIREIRWGDPTSAILSYTVENEIDVIVMGTHGRTGYEHYLLGSVAEKVIRVAPIPVLTVAVGDTDAKTAQILTAPSPGTSNRDEIEETESDEEDWEAEESPFS